MKESKFRREEKRATNQKNIIGPNDLMIKVKILYYKTFGKRSIILTITL